MTMNQGMYEKLYDKICLKYMEQMLWKFVQHHGSFPG